MHKQKARAKDSTLGASGKYFLTIRSSRLQYDTLRYQTQKEAQQCSPQNDLTFASLILTLPFPLSK